MSVILVPVTFTIVLWWSSTVLVMYLDGLGRNTFRWSMLAATLVAIAAVWGLAATAADTSVGAVYWSFAYALAVWGWNELAFLTGFVTGPRKMPCSASCRGWSRFRHAFEAIVYHELALLGSIIVVAVAGSGGPNQIGLTTVLALWLMRLSSKLNVFLGVPNLGEELLPDGLKYLGGFFRRRPMNLLFPISVTLLTLAITLLIYRATAPGITPAAQTGFVLLAALVALGALEHWLLVLPIPNHTLWSVGLKSRAPTISVNAAPPGVGS